MAPGRKNNRNTILSALGILLIAAVFTLPLTGCIDFVDDLFAEEPSELYYSPLFLQNSEELSTETESYSIEVLSTDLPVIQWEKPDPKPDFSSGSTPYIGDEETFDALMEYILNSRKSSFSFYATNQFTIDNDYLLYRYSLPYVSTNYTITEDGDEYWNVYIEYYPGTKISDAYETGNTYNLSSDELKVLEMATDFIENTVNQEDNPLVKERLIHDYICFSTVYTNPRSDDPVPRHCTAVGLLLDGEANCQGYTDCFVMLARMAGFQAQRQSGSADGSLHVWNIILLDGQWYSVDVTYNDTTFKADGSTYPSYIYFNAGEDILGLTHSVPAVNRLTYISPYSDGYYFYYSGLFADAGYGEDTDYSEEAVADLLTMAYSENIDYVSFFAQDQKLESRAIVNVIQGLIEGLPNPITVTTYIVGPHTYIMAEPR